jgi:enoyl-[acyl-carrier protein] reductase I
MLTGKKILITGLANEWSIAYHIAKEAKAQGASLFLTYPNDIIKSRVENLAKEFETSDIFHCDVADQESIKSACQAIREKAGKLDGFLHAIAFADKNELRGPYLNTSYENFTNSLNISCYSLTAMTRELAPVLSGASIITLSYYGAEKVIPNYNVMGVAKAALEASVKYLARDLGSEGTRINAISAGPIKTLAASGIGDFKKMLNYNEKNSPLRRNVSGEDLAKTAAFLFSDGSKAITGEILHVDCGFNIMGMQEDE